MRLNELFEYRLFKNNAGFKIYVNPSAGDIRAILRNSYILSKLQDIDTGDPIALDSMEDEYVHYGGNIHSLDYPLRGVIINGTVYIVDSYDADHEDLNRTLRNQGIKSADNIPITIEKQTGAPRKDLEDYMVSASQVKVDILKHIPAIARMKMPIGVWK